MPVTRDTRIWPRILYSRITFVVLSIVAVVLSLSVYERYTIEREMASRRSEAEAELEALKTRKLELEEKVKYLSADEGIEAEIRRHFDVAREGEQVVIIVDDEVNAAAATLATPPATSTDEEGFWSRIIPW